MLAYQKRVSDRQHTLSISRATATTDMHPRSFAAFFFFMNLSDGLGNGKSSIG